MSRATVRIAYDGEAFQEHKIDVRDLAPSMLALADIFAEANRVFNGDEATLNVFVKANFEENCFDFGLEIHQTWAAVKSLLSHDDTLAAKDLLNLVLLGGGAIGMVSGGALALYRGVLAALRAIRGRKPNSIVRIDLDGKTAFRYEFDTGEPLTVDARVHVLYQSSKIRRAFQRVFDPILSKPGRNKFVAYRPGGGAREEVSSEEARLFDPVPDDDVGRETLGSQTVRAWLRVYSPVYDLKAPKWRFWYGQDHHYMDVTQSNIARVVLDHGGALTNDLFNVNLEINQTINHKGEVVNEYKVGEVLEFRPGSRQADLFLESRPPEEDEAEPEDH